MLRRLLNLTQKHGLSNKTLAWILLLHLLFTFVIPTAMAELNNGYPIRPNNTVFTFSQTVWVPDNYTKIQWAINNASEGTTIRVRAGLYNETVVVNKTVSIIGENKDNTIIDAKGKGPLFNVKADNVVISGFTLRNGYSGVSLWQSKNTTIRGNNIDNMAYGIKVYQSSNSTIEENNVNDSQWFNIELDQSGNSTLQNNHMTGNRYNLRIDGDTLPDFINNIDTTNTVNGKPVHYLINQRDITINSSVLPSIGYLALINSTNVTVKNLNLVNSGQGILFAYTTNSVISNLTTTSNWNGIEVKAASNVTVTENKANNNFDFGIKFEHSSNSIVTKNNANNNGWAGIGIFTTQNSVVNANIVKNNINYGIDLVYSTSNIVTRNNVTNIGLAYSMVLYYSNFNLIYHNNFINHYIYKYVPITNTWDNGLEGNYWKNYNGTDTNQDGIGDTPYILEQGNKDNYPLMGRFSIFNLTPEYYAATISNLTISDFQFDQANKILSFRVTDENETSGFCRICISKALVGNTYRVQVNNREPLALKVLPYSNSTYEYIYLLYAQSTLQGTVLEFLVPMLLLSSLLIAFTLMVIAQKKKARASVRPKVLT